MSNSIQKPAALVTGSAKRLGKAIALGLAAKGYDIAVHYNTSKAEADATVAEIQALGVRCESFSCNLGDAAAIPALMENVVAAFPNLEILVNSASSYTQATIANTTLDIYENLVNVNFRAPFFLTKEYGRLVGKGNIINMLDNKIGFNQYPYAAFLLGKKALAELTKMAAIEYGPNIRVNGVAPGVILPANSRSSEYLEWREEAIPLKRQGRPYNIIQAILFVLENDFVTGQHFIIDGGENIAQIGRHAGAYDQNKV